MGNDQRGRAVHDRIADSGLQASSFGLWASDLGFAITRKKIFTTEDTEDFGVNFALCAIGRNESAKNRACVRKGSFFALSFCPMMAASGHRS